MPNSVLIFGSAGQLGQELAREFRRRGAAVHCFTRTSVDITSFKDVEAAIARLDPAIVVNSAAYNQVDVAESEPLTAYQANALAVRNMAVVCRQLDARLVHFSTDYVFDGSLGRPYREDDATHPLSAYAVSKLAGELYAQAYLDNALVIRTSGVFGPGGRSTARGNFLEMMLRLARQGQPIRVVADHVASPTYAPELARVTADLVDRKITGVVHAGGGQAISWYDYAQIIFDAAGLSPELRPTHEREYRTAARRPKFSALENARMVAERIAPMPPLADSVRDYLAVRAGS